MSRGRVEQFYFKVPYSLILWDETYARLSPAAKCLYIGLLAYISSLYPDGQDGQATLTPRILRLLTGRRRDRSLRLLNELTQGNFLSVIGHAGAQSDQRVTEKWVIEVKKLNKVTAPNRGKAPLNSPPINLTKGRSSERRSGNGEPKPLREDLPQNEADLRKTLREANRDYEARQAH